MPSSFYEPSTRPNSRELEFIVPSGHSSKQEKSASDDSAYARHDIANLEAWRRGWGNAHYQGRPPWWWNMSNESGIVLSTNTRFGSRRDGDAEGASDDDVSEGYPSDQEGDGDSSHGHEDGLQSMPSVGHDHEAVSGSSSGLDSL